MKSFANFIAGLPESHQFANISFPHFSLCRVLVFVLYHFQHPYKTTNRIAGVQSLQLVHQPLGGASTFTFKLIFQGFSYFRGN